MHKKLSDLIIVLVFPLLIFIAVFKFGFKINYLESLVVVFGIPSLYLSLRNKEKIKKIGYFSILIGIPIAFIFDLIVAFGDNGWVITHSIIPYRLFGVICIEDFLWTFLVSYLIIIFYEHFSNKNFDPKISSRIKTMNYVFYLSAISLVLIYFFNNSLLKIPYAYLIIGIILWVIPIFIFLSKYPSFFKNFFKVDLYFFYIYLIYQLVSLNNNLWVFPSKHYIGWITIIGIRFPLEEFIFIICLGGFAACTYYEFFTNRSLE